MPHLPTGTTLHEQPVDNGVSHIGSTVSHPGQEESNRFPGVVARLEER